MMRLPWHGKTVPHAVVDILRGCNCRCADCYNSVQPCVKPLDDIKAAVAKSASNDVFDLSGRRVSNPTKGIYIIDGKKVLVK